MATSRAITTRARLHVRARLPERGREHPWWMQHREATLNWLALGLLLAAWNAADENTPQLQRRPETLRGYAYVSVRAATLNSEQRRIVASN